MSDERNSAEKRVRWTYQQTSPEKLEQWYDEWAKDYDQDLIEVYGYLGPVLAADVAARYLRKDARILEAGVGTGLAGRALKQRGFMDIVGIDFSKGMLKEARKTAIYHELHRMVLGERLDFADNEFDAAIAVGTFTSGHAPASGLIEMTRATRIGGKIIFTLKTDSHEQIGFTSTRRQLEEGRRWRLIEESEPLQMLPKSEPDVRHQVWVFEVTG